MKKFIDSVTDVAAEALAGFAAANPNHVVLAEQGGFLRRRHLISGKVALVSGGGSGHEPLHAGFVGPGMLDAACPGHIFTSPTPGQVSKAIAAAETGAGCLVIVKNYTGDRLNFEMAAELVNLPVRTVIVADEVLLEGGEEAERRGLAGTLIVEKILGAAAEQGLGLDELWEFGRRTVERTRTIGVTLMRCSPHFVRGSVADLGPDEVEFGVGIHGELGRRRVPLRPARDLANDMLAALLADIGSVAGEDVLLFVNGLGATPLMELYLMFAHAEQAMARAGARVARRIVGTYVTSLDTAGCSITVTRLDEQMKAAWDAPVDTPALRWGC